MRARIEPPEKRYIGGAWVAPQRPGYVEGKLNLDGLISHRLPLERINEGFELMRQGQTAQAVVIYD